jgi:hypothetical protein
MMHANQRISGVPTFKTATNHIMLAMSRIMAPVSPQISRQSQTVLVLPWNAATPANSGRHVRLLSLGRGTETVSCYIMKGLLVILNLITPTLSFPRLVATLGPAMW